MCQASQQDKFIKLNDSVYLKYARHSTRILKLIRDSTTMEKKNVSSTSFLLFKRSMQFNAMLNRSKYPCNNIESNFRISQNSTEYSCCLLHQKQCYRFCQHQIYYVEIIGNVFKVSAVMRRNLIAKMYKKKIYSSQVKKRSHFMSAVFLRNLTLKYGI